MTRSSLVDVTVAMSRELLSQSAYEREEREASKAQMRREGMDETEIALIFGEPVAEPERAPVHRGRIMEPY